MENTNISSDVANEFAIKFFGLKQTEPKDYSPEPEINSNSIEGWDDTTLIKFIRSPKHVSFINNTSRRKQAIIDNDTSAYFPVSQNIELEEFEPWYEFCLLNTVNKYDKFINLASKEKNVDADLIRAIMYMETSHGYYDYPAAMIDKQKSILPMNINYDYWGNAFGTREQLKDPAFNIMAGAEMLRRLARLAGGKKATIEQIASLYNNLTTQKVNQYGKHVARIYRDKPWERPFCITFPWQELNTQWNNLLLNYIINSLKGQK